MFDHKIFEVFDFENIPMNRDCFLMDEMYMREYEENILRVFAGGDGKNVGLISWVACDSIRENALELSWHVNIFDRFHSIPVVLPKDKLIACVECREMSEKPHLFVEHDWLEELFLQTHSVFCMVDASDFKKFMEDGSLSKESLAKLRDKIDELGKEYPQIVFISFADSLLLKSNWSVGYYAKGIKNTYNPEIFVEVVSKLADIYLDVLNLDIYAILTQGANGYYDNSLLHVSGAGNHISLNSLGIPFADLLAIELAAKHTIKQGRHKRMQLYMDRSFYLSLKFKSEFKRDEQRCYVYESKMKSANSQYYANDIKTIQDALHKE